MIQIGVWERETRLAEQMAKLAEGRGLVRACSHPALLAGLELDLLIAAPSASGWAGASALTVRTALLPGEFSPLLAACPSPAILTYGPAARNTLTLSGLNDGMAAVAIQREFCTLSGSTVDRQELVLPFNGDGSPDLFLARVGAALLLELPLEKSL